MRSDREIAEYVMHDRGTLADLSHEEITRALDVGILTESGPTSADVMAAERWLSSASGTREFEMPRGFDPKLVEARRSEKSNPQHYQRDGIEPIDVIEAWSLDFRLANAVKYISRAGRKPGQTRDDDLRKAIDYLHRALTGRWPWQETDHG